jgi:hypothetical protein
LTQINAGSDKIKVIKALIDNSEQNIKGSVSVIIKQNLDLILEEFTKRLNRIEKMKVALN